MNRYQDDYPVLGPLTDAEVAELFQIVQIDNEELIGVSARGHSYVWPRGEYETLAFFND